MELFSARLKFLSQNSGLQTYQVADKLRISTESYKDLENGQREPNIDMLAKLPSIFEESVDFLIGVTDYDKRGTSYKRQYMRSVVGYIVSEERIKELNNLSTESPPASVLSTIEAIRKEYVSDMLRFRVQQRELKDTLYNYLGKIPFVSSKIFRYIEREIADKKFEISSDLSSFYPPLLSLDWRLTEVTMEYRPHPEE
ncbi:helix-turn-helix domain-containing protein [Paenibacillus amylolyticus]|uniref:helix-turn-helix domain-containing protein n=1 Tax=Paenibacillus amylolyticus TaxID=1451 RepID=UPI003F7E2EDF